MGASLESRPSGDIGAGRFVEILQPEHIVEILQPEHVVEVFQPGRIAEILRPLRNRTDAHATDRQPATGALLAAAPFGGTRHVAELVHPAPWQRAGG